MKKNILKIDSMNCKGCGLCVVECRDSLLKMSKDVNHLGYYPVEITDPSKCIGCTLCAVACPDAIIEVSRIEE